MGPLCRGRAGRALEQHEEEKEGRRRHQRARREEGKETDQWSLVSWLRCGAVDLTFNSYLPRYLRYLR